MSLVDTTREPVFGHNFRLVLQGDFPMQTQLPKVVAAERPPRATGERSDVPATIMSGFGEPWLFQSRTLE